MGCWGRNISKPGRSQYKGPEAGVDLALFQEWKEQSGSSRVSKDEGCEDRWKANDGADSRRLSRSFEGI